MSTKKNNNNTKVEEVKDQAETKAAEAPETPADAVVAETKKNVVDKAYDWYCGKRDKAALKKANKRKLTKMEKAGIATGGILLGGAIIGGIAKTVLGGFTNTAEADEDTFDSDTLYIDEGDGSGFKEADTENPSDVE